MWVMDQSQQMAMAMPTVNTRSAMDRAQTEMVHWMATATVSIMKMAKVSSIEFFWRCILTLIISLAPLQLKMARATQMDQRPMVWRMESDQVKFDSFSILFVLSRYSNASTMTPNGIALLSHETDCIRQPCCSNYTLIQYTYDPIIWDLLVAITRARLTLLVLSFCRARGSDFSVHCNHSHWECDVLQRPLGHAKLIETNDS